jgi:proteasome lid subunit RPN8/RPN11
MLDHASAEAPNECCGLLLGKGDDVLEVFPGRNVHMSPKVYEMDPRDQLRAFQRMDAQGWDLVAIYHSHPATEAFPSRTDRAKALYPDARYIIISLADHSQPQVRAFRIEQQTDGQGAPVRDGDGSTVKVVTEEEVVVT